MFKFINLYLIILVTALSCKSNPEFKLSKDSFDEVEKSNIDSTLTDKLLNNYDLKSPSKKWKLDDSLKEISGINILENGNAVAIEDLRPVIYEIDLKADTGRIIDKKTFFNTDKDKMDMEDLAVVGNDIYALWSHGVIFKIAEWRTNNKSEEMDTRLNKKNNTEGMAFDPATGNLLIACKNDAGLEDEKKSTKAIYQFDPGKQKLLEAPFITINKKDFKKITSQKISFNPSAIAINPVTGNIFIISTKDNKCIAVFTSKGRLVDFSFLDEKMLPQPEGLCFDKKGNLYISTEGKGNVAPAILQFAKK